MLCRTRQLHAAGGEISELTAELQAASTLKLAWQQLAGKAAERQQQPMDVVVALPAEGPPVDSSAGTGIAALSQEGLSIGPPKMAEKEQ